MLAFACISPHPPIIIPEIGKDEIKKVKKTSLALELLNKKFVQSKPETVILISPHAPLFPDFFVISSTNIFSGDFQQFGDFKNYFEFKSDLQIANQIYRSCENEKIPAKLVPQSQLDHGALVPLYYLMKNLQSQITQEKTENTDRQQIPKLVLLSFSLLDLKTHFKFGKLLQKITSLSNKKIAVIASGDLSHRLTPEAPAGFHKDGKKFDENLVNLLKNNDVGGILNLDSQLVENAGECGLRSLVILLGVLEKLDYKSEILSYEGPFGVGYLVANFKIANQH